MYTYKYVNDGSEIFRNNYLECVVKAFPRLLPLAANSGKHIAILYEGKIVAGFSYKEHADISDDQVISEYWYVKEKVSGTRIFRLWANSSNQVATINYLFSVGLEVFKDTNYIYGILSLPLNFVNLRSEQFEQHLDKVLSKNSITNCQWENIEDASSDGKKLFKMYQKMGGLILGPLSASNPDQSVKLLMGVPVKQIQYKNRSVVEDGVCYA